ncbi:MAG: IPT/TIG domain-containing protein, partial [Terracidiphilus sp.]
MTIAGLPTNGIAFTVLVPPAISSISPASGPVGAAVTITGTNFGSTQGSVTFNGTAATISSWTNTAIVAFVPAGATTGNVVVTVGGMASNSFAFTVLPTPSISSLSPTSGVAGTSVTITGTNFGSSQGSSTVKFNGTAASVSSWSNTSIVAAVPSGTSTGSVVVTVSGVASNGVTFTVPLSPSISSLSPSSGSWGTSVTISGANFGSTQGSSTVKFSGVAATVSSWSNTSIVAVVPSGIVTGSVVVTANGLVSNAATFTVSGAYSLSVGPGTLVFLQQTTTSSCPIGSGAPPPMGTLTVTQFENFTFTVSGSTQSLSGGFAYISSPGGNFGCPAGGWTTPIPVTLTGSGFTILFTPSVGGAGSATYVLTPSISSLSPTSGTVGTSVTITGSNFGSTQGSST